MEKRTEHGRERTAISQRGKLTVTAWISQETTIIPYTTSKGWSL